jgi:DNA-damage-inducible protein D
MYTERQISGEHVTNNEAVRQTLLSRGIRPEILPPAEDVMKDSKLVVSASNKDDNQRRNQNFRNQGSAVNK